MRFRPLLLIVLLVAPALTKPVARPRLSQGQLLFGRTISGITPTSTDEPSENDISLGCVTRYTLAENQKCDNITSKYGISASEDEAESAADSQTCKDLLKGYRICLDAVPSDQNQTNHTLDATTSEALTQTVYTYGSDIPASVISATSNSPAAVTTSTAMVIAVDTTALTYTVGGATTRVRTVVVTRTSTDVQTYMTTVTAKGNAESSTAVLDDSTTLPTTLATSLSVPTLSAVTVTLPVVSSISLTATVPLVTSSSVSLTTAGQDANATSDATASVAVPTTLTTAVQKSLSTALAPTSALSSLTTLATVSKTSLSTALAPDSPSSAASSTSVVTATDTSSSPAQATSSTTASTAVRADNTTSTASSASATSTSSGVPYKTYLGDGTPADGWPSMDQWLDFDTIFTSNMANMKASCMSEWLVPNDSDDEISDIKSSVQSISQATGLDARFIFATIMQESTGCVRVITTSYSHANPGLMQSFNGSGSCNTNGAALGVSGTSSSGVQTPCPSSEINQMILDGTNGTVSGPGLVQNMENVGEVKPQYTGASKYYWTSKVYNGGNTSLASETALEDGCCTRSYVSDIANRLTGWATGTSQFSG